MKPERHPRQPLITISGRLFIAASIVALGGPTSFPATASSNPAEACLSFANLSNFRSRPRRSHPHNSILRVLCQRMACRFPPIVRLMALSISVPASMGIPMAMTTVSK
jgi:hypothetical protein